MKKIMRLFLASVLCGILPITLLFGGVSVSAYTGNSSQTLTAGADIRVMSYNTLVDNDEANGGWSWGRALGNRAEKAAAAINYYKPDVIGLQENNYNWHVALRELLPDYDYVNANVPMSMPLEARESLGKKDWMCTTMMYNTKTLEMVDYELIGYSVNYWGCIQRMRYLSMALFKVKATGEMFVFTSTHFDAENYADGRGQKNRVTQATEMAENIQRYMETYGCPVISTGDFNSGYNDDPIAKIRDMTGMQSHSSNRGGIDYILYSQGVSSKYFTVINDADLSGASDHQPIMADLVLQDGFSFPTTTTTTVTTTTTTTTTTTATTTARPTASQTTTTTQGKPIASVTTTNSVVVDPSVNTTDATASTTQAVADAPTEESIPSTTIAASEESTVTTSATQAKPSEEKAVSANKKDDKEEKKEDKNKDNVGVAIGIAIAIAAVGVIAAVAAVLMRKKK